MSPPVGRCGRSYSPRGACQAYRLCRCIFSRFRNSTGTLTCDVGLSHDRAPWWCVVVAASCRRLVVDAGHGERRAGGARGVEPRGRRARSRGARGAEARGGGQSVAEKVLLSKKSRTIWVHIRRCNIPYKVLRSSRHTETDSPGGPTLSSPNVVPPPKIPARLVFARRSPAAHERRARFSVSPPS